MGRQQRRKRAVALGLATGVLLVAAWLADAPAGPVVALAGVAMGWLIASAMAPAAVVNSVAQAAPAAPAALEKPAPEPDPASEGAAITALRHDLRGILSPAMLIADRLVSHDDPSVQRAGDLINRTVERAAARLAETKKAEPQKTEADAASPPAYL